MKTKMYFIAAVAMILLVSVGCQRTGPEVEPEPEVVAVTGVELDEPSLTMEIGHEVTLKATVLPTDAENLKVSWTSSDDNVAKVGDGLVTALSAGSATITVITDDGKFEADCQVTVNAPEHSVLGIVSFKTATTWETGDLTWSDVVMVSAARGKTDFNGGSSAGYLADFRDNEGYGDLFSWEAVSQYKDVLCPEGWRVPTMTDFVALDIALGGDGTNVWGEPSFVTSTYLNPEVWGGTYGGHCNGTGVIDEKGSQAGYWSQTTPDWDPDNSYSLVVNSAGLVYPQFTYNKDWGYMLRCVKGEATITNVLVTGVELQSSLTMEIDQVETLAATVLPSNATNRNVTWASSNDAIVKVENGVVTALSPGQAVITVQTEDGGYKDTCEITVNAGAEHPVFGIVSFRTETTWEVGGQTWSDVVMASNASGKTDYNGGDVNGNYSVDFRENPGYGDLFSWTAVELYHDSLCPDDWRMPSKEDYIALDVAFGGNGEWRWAESNVEFFNNTYLNPEVWGGALGGRVEGNGSILAAQTFWAHYWSLTSYDAGHACTLTFSFDGEIGPQQAAFKADGYPIRCVK